jgi:iron complex transport system substrate-binding protein
MVALTWARRSGGIARRMRLVLARLTFGAHPISARRARWRFVLALFLAGVAFGTAVGFARQHRAKTPEARVPTALGADGIRKAEDFLRYYRRNLRRVDAALATASDRQRPRVYFASTDPLRTEGRGSMADSWITSAGGQNVAAEAVDRDGRVSFDQVIRWAPDVIVVLEASVRAAIVEDPRWQSLAAVREGLVMVNPRGINAWCTRASETALQVLWAAKLFHPGLLADVDLRREVRDFHQRFYGYVLTEGEIDRMLSGAPPDRS